MEKRPHISPKLFRKTSGILFTEREKILRDFCLELIGKIKISEGICSAMIDPNHIAAGKIKWIEVQEEMRASIRKADKFKINLL